MSRMELTSRSRPAKGRRPGDDVLVSGELSVREFERKDGSKGQSIELRVYEIGPSMKWNGVKIARADRSGSPAHGSSGSDRGAPADDPWGAQSGPVDQDLEAPF